MDFILLKRFKSTVMKIRTNPFPLSLLPIQSKRRQKGKMVIFANYLSVDVKEIYLSMTVLEIMKL